MKTFSCPERNQLVSFLSGHSDEGSAELMHLHLSICAECQQALVDSCQNDSAIQLLKQGLTGGIYESEVALHGAMNRIRKMGPLNDHHSSEDSTVQLNAEQPNTPRRGSDEAFAQATVPQIEGYEIIGILGRGGMGVVYKARQAGLNRIVALKMILSGKHASQAEAARFQAEAEAIARLHHPNIVQIYAIGVADGHPYFSLEYLDGGNLSAVLGGAPQPTDECAKLMRSLAEAVQFAHDNGVVHRDLKPANILLTKLSPSRTTSNLANVAASENPIRHSREASCDLGTPKIADFGLAKQLNIESDHTASGSILGSPSYMSPEQASGNLRGIGPASDIYSLGAILYEMLTGRPPFRAASILETLDQVRSQEPLSPRQLISRIPTDLETICLKCLQKDPAKRYTSANHLAEDLRRFLADEPILARPVNAIERTCRWVNRNPAVAALMAAVLLVGLLGFSGIVWQWREAVAVGKVNKKLAQDAELKSQEERWERYRSSLNLVCNVFDQQNYEAARKALVSAPDEHRGWEWRHFSSQFDAAQSVLYFGETDFQYCPVFDIHPKHRQLAMHAPDGSVEWWDPVGSSPFQSVHQHRQRALRVAYSPDGNRLAVAANNHEIHVWDVETRQRLFRFQGHTQDVLSLVFNSDATRLASGGLDSEVRIWNTESGEVHYIQQNGKLCSGLAFTPSGSHLFIASGIEIKCVSLATNEVTGVIADQTDISCIAINAEGTRLARGSGGPEYTITVWDARSFEKVMSLAGHSSRVTQLIFSPDGQQLASSSSDKSVRVWDAIAGENSMILAGHGDGVYGLAFSTDGTRLVSGSLDGTGRIWDAKAGVPLAILRGHRSQVAQVAFSGDGKQVVSASFDGTMCTWDTQAAESAILRGHKSFVYDVTFLDDDHIASVGWDGALRTWDLLAGKQTQSMQHAGDIVTSVAHHPRSHQIATLSRFADKDQLGREITIWNAASGKNTRSIHLEKSNWIDARCTFNPSGDEIAVGDNAGQIRVFDARSASEVACFGEHIGGAIDVAYRPDGKQLASCGVDGMIRLWNTSTWSQIAPLKGHKGEVNQIAYSYDVKLLASASNDKSVRIWNAHSAELIAELLHASTVYCVAFSSDGARLATGSGDKTIRLWDLKNFQEIAVLRGHQDYVHAIAFSPDGTRLVSASGDSTIHVWDTLPLSERQSQRVK